MTMTVRSRQYAGAVVAWAVLLTTGCTGGDEPDPPPASTPGQGSAQGEPAAAPTDVEPVVRSGAITGRLPRQDRHRAEAAVADVAVGYLEAAYLAGEYPRGDFRDAYRGFTGGAAQVARRDRALLTNQKIAPRVAGVEPSRLAVRVDLLAADMRAVAATAHVELRFRATGKVEQRVDVQGRLLMTRQDGRWRIFAYDLTKGAR